MWICTTHPHQLLLNYAKSILSWPKLVGCAYTLIYVYLRTLDHVCACVVINNLNHTYYKFTHIPKLMTQIFALFATYQILLLTFKPIFCTLYGIRKSAEILKCIIERIQRMQSFIDDYHHGFFGWYLLLRNFSSLLVFFYIERCKLILQTSLMSWSPRYTHWIIIFSLNDETKFLSSKLSNIHTCLV